MPLTANESKALVEGFAKVLAGLTSGEANVAEAELPLEPAVESTIPPVPAESTTRQYPTKAEKAARSAANKQASKDVSKALKEGHAHVKDGDLVKAKRSLAAAKKVMRGRVAEVGPKSCFVPDGTYGPRVSKLAAAIKAA